MWRKCFDSSCHQAENREQFSIENYLSYQYQMKREGTSVMRLTCWSLKGCQRLIRLATECKLFGDNSAMMSLISRSCPQPDEPLIRASDHRSDHGKRSLHQDNATLPWWTQGNSADLSLVVEKVHFRWDPLQSTRSTAIHLLRASEPYWWTNSPPA